MAPATAPSSHPARRRQRGSRFSLGTAAIPCPTERPHRPGTEVSHEHAQRPDPHGRGEVHADPPGA